MMNIHYNDTKKDLPVEQLSHLFGSVGWSKKEIEMTPEVLCNFNIPFINSTLVISAWDNERLVGAVRVLSDQFGRSVIYDLLVDPDYQKKGIGKELVRRCIAHFPNSGWLLETTEENIGFYEKVGFKQNKGVFFSIPSFFQRME